MDADLLVHGQQGRAEESGEFARAPAAQEVHLEKAVLRVEIAQGAHQVLAVGSVDRGHAVGVALDRDGGVQPRQAPAARQRRQAAADEQPARQSRRRDEQQEDQAGGAQGAERTAARGRVRVHGLGVKGGRNPGALPRTARARTAVCGGC